MLISEAIKRLTEILVQEGDLPLIDSEDGNSYEIEDLAIMQGPVLLTYDHGEVISEVLLYGPKIVMPVAVKK